MTATPEQKQAAQEAHEAEYRLTHDAHGYPIPDNREGRRAAARSWKRRRGYTR